MIIIRTDNTILKVGGDDEPTRNEFEDFITKFSEYIGVENSGVYLSNEEGENAKITTIYFDEYEGNEPERSYLSPRLLHSDERTKNLNVITRLHTHPTNTGKSRNDIKRASLEDLNTKAASKGQFLLFMILTRSEDNRVKRIGY